MYFPSTVWLEQQDCIPFNYENLQVVLNAFMSQWSVVH